MLLLSFYYYYYCRCLSLVIAKTHVISSGPQHSLNLYYIGLRVVVTIINPIIFILFGQAAVIILRFNGRVSNLQKYTLF